MKKKLSLLANVDNSMNFPQSTIDTFALDESMKQIMISSVGLFLKRASNHFSVGVISKQLDNELKNFDIVYMNKYPLPASFNTMTKKGVINIAIFNKRDVINVDPRDLYTIIFYCYVYTLFNYVKVKDSMATTIADFLFSVYMKVYGKKYGLAGSYESEIPKLRFLITVHTLMSFFNMDRKKAYIQATNLSTANEKSFNINLNEYNFTEINELIRCLSDSGVLKGLNTYYFVSTMINRFLPHNICMFEDIVRFISVLAGSSINANTLFPSSLQFYNRSMYDNILNYVETYIK